MLVVEGADAVYIGRGEKQGYYPGTALNNFEMAGAWRGEYSW